MEYSKLKVTELKAELAKRDLSIKGLKKDLVDRLTKADEEKDVTMASIDAVEVRNEVEMVQPIDITIHEKEEPMDPTTHGNGIEGADMTIDPPVEQPSAGSGELPEPTVQNTVAEAIPIKVSSTQQTTIEAPSTDVPVVQPKSSSAKPQPSAPAPPPSPTKRKRNITAEPPSKQSIPTAIHPATTSLYISNLIRPLTILQVRSTLEEFGPVKRLWLDNIKSHAYVIFESIAEATKAREVLENQKFPPDTGREIHLEYIPSDRVNQLIQHEERSQKDGVKVELDVKRLEFRSNKSSGRNFPLPNAPQSQNVKVLSLDELFSKTSTKPSLYFKPVSEDEAAKRLLQL